MLDKRTVTRHTCRIMKITPELTDQAILQELGGRLARVRIEHHLTQAALAEQAGLAKRTVERLESGEVATQFTSFLRVCRVLGLLERFENFLPKSRPSPMEQLKEQGRMRKRVARNKEPKIKAKKWTWGEP